MAGRNNDPLLLGGGRRRLDQAVELAIHASAVFVIAAVVLIFVFVGKEALPVITSKMVHEEVTVGSMIVPQDDGQYTWQPMSTQPKYCLLPLLIGTMKVTLVSLVIAIPVAIAAAVFTSEFAPPLLRKSSSRWWSCWPASPRW